MSEINLFPSEKLKLIKSDFCKCQSILVDEQERIVRCQRCNKVLDPFDYLYGQAKDQGNIIGWIKHLHIQRSKLHTEIEDLKRERKNLKAQVNRLKKKVEPDK